MILGSVVLVMIIFSWTVLCAATAVRTTRLSHVHAAVLQIKCVNCVLMMEAPIAILA